MRTFLPAAAVLLLACGGAQAQPAPSDTVPAAHAPAKPMRAVSPRQRRAVEAGVEPDGAAPPTSDYRGGVGSPFSATATNLTGGREGTLGSRLPDPGTAADAPEGLLAAAQAALNKGQTGAAQQALEMAETRALTRTTDPALANQPSTATMVRQIGLARQALGRRDTPAAKAAIQAAMAAPVPPRGPATTGGPGSIR